jgi:hypothetical protein
MTTNHEMAHQMDLQVKPNVILLISRINQNDNLYIQYSGYSYAYDIASILQGTDEKSFDQILKQFIRNIKKLSGKYKFQKRI